jgi:hypothetical protein
LSQYGFTKASLKRHYDSDVRRFIVELIITDLQPISIVEDDGFRLYTDRAFPGTKIPSRKTVIDDIVKLHTAKKEVCI